MNGEMNVDVIENGQQQPKIPDEEKKTGLSLLVHDFKQRELIPIKIIYFLLFSAYGVMLPYAAVHMKSLGMNVEETGLVFGITSVVSVVIPFCTGMLADKLGNFKVLLIATHVIASVVALLFLLVPVGRMSVNYPVNMTLAIGCDNDLKLNNSSHLTLTRLDSYPCKFKFQEELESGFISANVSLAFENCKQVCYHNMSTSEEEKLLRRTSTYDTLEETEFQDVVFFPEDWNLNVSCSKSFDGEVCSLDKLNDSQLPSTLTFGLMVPTISNDSVTFSIRWIMTEESNDPKSRIHCGNYKQVQLPSERNSDGLFQFCQTQCIVRANRSDLCSNEAHQIVINPKFTFGLYLLLRLTFEVMINGAITLFEGASLALVNRLDGDYGTQKCFGFIGTAIFSPISGALVDYLSIDSGSPDFRPIFYLFAGLYGTAALVMLSMNLDFKPPTEKLLNDMKSIFKNVELNALFAITFLTGILLGGTGNFLFLFLEEIGCSKTLMGLAIMVSCVAAVPTLLLSDTIFRKFGHPNVIVFCFAVYVIRLMGYSYISNPRLCLVYEFIEAITGTLATTSIITYSVQLGSTSTLASIQGLIAAIYFGLGSGIVGSFVGSFIIEAYGQRMTFRILAVVAFTSGLCYSFFNAIYIRRKNNATNKVENVYLKPDVST